LDTGLRDLIGAVRADTTDTMLVDASSLSLGVPARPASVPGRKPTGLTRRELQVLALLAEGCSPPAIAARLVISIYTARGHVKNVLRKLDAHSQLEAVATASRMGLLPPRGSSSDDTRPDAGPQAPPVQMAWSWDAEPLRWRRDA
jgi:DNA-binding CsgD family transcriptional regulator